MTAEGPTLRIVAENLDDYQMCSSDMEVPIEQLIEALQTIDRFRPLTGVSVGAIRTVLLDINDGLIRDATRWTEQTGVEDQVTSK